MSSALLLLTDTDASLFSGFATHFSTVNRGILALMYLGSSVSVPAPEAHCSTAAWTDAGMNYGIKATGRDRLGTMRHSRGSICLTNLLMNNVPISRGTARVSMAQNRESTCKLPSLTKSMIFSITLTCLSDTDLRNMLGRGPMLSRHLTGREDTRAIFGPTPVSKTLTVGLDIFDLILMDMWTL